MDFTLIERSGIKRIDFAKLVGVNRSFVTHWIKGTNPRKNSAYYAKLEKLMRILSHNVDKGSLPCHPDKYKELISKLSTKLDGQSADQ